MPPVVLSETATETTVQTEDGRILTLPKQFAAQYGLGAPTLGGLQQGLGNALAPQQPSMPQSPEPEWVSNPPAGPQLPVNPGPPDAITGTAPSPIAPQPAQQTVQAAPRPPVMRGAGPAAYASPQTNPAPAQAQAAPVDPFRAAQGLAGQGFALQEDAIARQSEAEARGAADVATAMEQRNAKLAEIEAGRAKQAEQDLAEKHRIEREYGDAVKAYGEHKIDERGGQPKLNSAKGVGLLVFQALAGIGEAMEGRNGNPAMDLVQQMVARNVQLQMAEREKLGQQVGMVGQKADRFSRLAGDRAAEFNLRMAGELEKVGRHIEGIQARTNSETVATRADQLLAQNRIAQAGYLEQAANGEWNRTVQLRQLQEQAAARAQAAAAQREDMAYRREQDQLNRDERQSNRAEDLALRRDELGLDVAKVNAAAGQKANETLRKEGLFFRGQQINKKDGSPLLTGNETITKELRTKIGQAERMAQIADELDRIYTKEGWTSDVLNSDANAQARALEGELVLIAKEQAKLGALSGADFDIMYKKIGTRDVTGYKDPRAGLAKFREGVVRGLNAELRANGYDGDPIEMPRFTTSALAPATESTEARLFRDIQAGPVKAPALGNTRRYAAQLAGDQSGASAEELSAAFASGEAPVVGTARAAFDALAVLASKPGGEGALKTLATVYLSDKRPRYREMAAGILLQNNIDFNDEKALKALAEGR